MISWRTRAPDSDCLLGKAENLGSCGSLENPFSGNEPISLVIEVLF